MLSEFVLLLLGVSFAYVVFAAITFNVLRYVSSKRKDEKEILADNDNVALIIAHPDDESMFFTPTILSLTNQSKDHFYIQCFTSSFILFYFLRHSTPHFKNV